MPCYPASRELATVSGMVANNGCRRKNLLKYGQNKDFVKSLKVVLSDGEEYEITHLKRRARGKNFRNKCSSGDLFESLESYKKNLRRNKTNQTKNK